MLARDHHSFTALVCHHDCVAIGAIQVLASFGLRVPDDVAVVGFEDDAVSSYLTPALTSVHAPARKIGIAAVQRVLAPDGERRRAELRPCELIVRQSCGARWEQPVRTKGHDRAEAPTRLQQGISRRSP